MLLELHQHPQLGPPEYYINLLRRRQPCTKLCIFQVPRTYIIAGMTSLWFFHQGKKVAVCFKRGTKYSDVNSVAKENLCKIVKKVRFIVSKFFNIY